MKTRADYPANWDEIRYAAYARANWTCEVCGIPFVPGTTKAVDARNKDGKPSILTIHHISGDTHDNEHKNLLVACQACHLHVQGNWKPGGVLPATWNPVPTWIVERGLPYVVVSVQLSMFGGKA